MTTFIRKKNIEQKIEDQTLHTGVRYKKNEDKRKEKWSKSGILFKVLQWFWRK
jgi:hypothetical protein